MALMSHKGYVPKGELKRGQGQGSPGGSSQQAGTGKTTLKGGGKHGSK